MLYSFIKIKLHFIEGEQHECLLVVEGHKKKLCHNCDVNSYFCLYLQNNVILCAFFSFSFTYCIPCSCYKDGGTTSTFAPPIENPPSHSKAVSSYSSSSTFGVARGGTFFFVLASVDLLTFSHISPHLRTSHKNMLQDLTQHLMT